MVAQVDSALLSHPMVTEAVSFGAPDEKYGESVAAAVVLSKSVDDMDATIADIKKTAAAKLSKFKVSFSFTVLIRMASPERVPHSRTEPQRPKIPMYAFVLLLQEPCTKPDNVCKLCGRSQSCAQVPEQIFITDKLPKGATGKIQRRNMPTAFLGRNKVKQGQMGSPGSSRQQKGERAKESGKPLHRSKL
jgi:acyl-coenzyme A synthetase/AMP-(fatty) acid ligase